MADREIRTSDAARRAYEYHIAGYDNFGDWPNLTVKLAERGFSEEELRKVLGSTTCGTSERLLDSRRRP